MRKEKLTFLETPIHLRCRTHVHTGQGRFCLVEAVSAPVIDGAEARCPTRDGLEYLLHVTMFRAKYGKNGELVVTIMVSKVRLVHSERDDLIDHLA